ncbi:hypothetical protein C8F01DRAFT_1146224 [Mycena amicta]|nr:hypothetical protein C8F01DRAFT_1146224 [Mycena amicta]
MTSRKTIPRTRQTSRTLRFKAEGALMHRLARTRPLQGVYLVDDEMDILETNEEYDSTLYLGAVVLGDDEVLTPFESLVEDSDAVEAIYFNFVLSNGALAQPIGDLRARYAELLLHRAQPYPADGEFTMDRRRFMVRARSLSRFASRTRTSRSRHGMRACSLAQWSWTPACPTSKNITSSRWATQSLKARGLFLSARTAEKGRH